MITKLDAVNQILDAIGESNVSSLSSGLPDAEDAEKVLNRVNLRVQAKGWHCNTDTEYLLTPEVSGYIPVPFDAISIDTDGRSRGIDVTVRVMGGTRQLYNRETKTFLFTQPLTCEIIRLLDFEALTYELAAFIAATAAVEYQREQLGSVALDSFTVQQMMVAETALQDAEGAAEDFNVLTDSISVASIVRRNHPLSGR